MSTQLDMFETKQPAPPKPIDEDAFFRTLKMLNMSRTQAGEYSKYSVNCYTGCGHLCDYCYVPATIRMAREEFNREAIPRFTTTKVKRDVLEVLEQDLIKMKANGYGIETNILMSFTTDPYHHGDVKHGITRGAIELIKQYGLSFTTLTKGGKRALRDIDLFRKNGVDMFASTLTTLDPTESLKIEGGAALPQDRIETLKQFKEKGIYTWVSLEPVFNPAQTIEIVKQTHEFVDLFKVGKINYHRIANTIDWQKFTDDIVKTLDSVGANRYIKNDLKPFLNKLN